MKKEDIAMQGMWWEFSKVCEDSHKWNCWNGHSEAVRKLLMSGQRFFLPDDVDLSVNKRYADVADLLRLPFDVVAVMSSSFVGEVHVAKRERTRIITIAVSAERNDAPAFRILPAAKWPPGRPWMILLPLVRTPYGWVPLAGMLVTKVGDGADFGLQMSVANSRFTMELMAGGLTTEQNARRRQRRLEKRRRTGPAPRAAERENSSH
jgi:hypothetical protein